MFFLLGNPSSTTFDVTLMIVLIRNLTPIAISDAIPHSTDVSEGGRTDIFYYIEVRTDTICYTVYNCPEMEKYRVNKIHIRNFIDPIFFVLEYCTLCSKVIVILQPNLISNVF
jgi:hypothetical protein